MKVVFCVEKKKKKFLGPSVLLVNTFYLHYGFRYKELFFWPGRFFPGRQMAGWSLPTPSSEKEKRVDGIITAFLAGVPY